MNDWIQKRAPDEVPTPLAVAVSDFCRRAGRAASASEVRLALSYLSGEDDFRVRPLTEAAPEASPLGPFAVVDLVRGAGAELASRREECGYYELVRQLGARSPAQASAGPAPETRRVEAPRKPPESSVPKHEETLAERIAPRKRAAGSTAEVEPQEPQGEPPPSGRRQLPAPRGRFTRLAFVKRPAEELLTDGAAEPLSTLIDQHGNRVALGHALSEQYAGRGGAPLTPAEVDAAVEHHRLGGRLASRERELILSAFREHRGASGRVAWALGLSPSELDRLVKGSGLAREVEELRERFRREALAPDLRYRLDLLGRHRYLSDLGIKDRFAKRLTSDLKELLEGCLGQASDLASLIDAAAKKHGLSAELLSRAVAKLGLAGPLTDRLP